VVSGGLAIVLVLSAGGKSAGRAGRCVAEELELPMDG
jgi:hypothetical protein